MIGGNTGTLVVNQGFEWSIINAGTAAVSLTSGVGHNIVAGSLVIAIGASARWLTRCTAQNTVISYRIT
jgi:hypothetical protein